MKCKIYMQYIDYYDINFDSKIDMSTEQYINEIKGQSEFNDENIYNKIIKNNNINFQLDKQNSEIKDNTKYKYSSCECNIFNIDNKEINIDELIEYFKNKEQFIILVELNTNTIEEECGIEMKMWINEHEKINRYDQVTNEWKLLHEPIRNIKFLIENDNKTECYGEFLNCKIADIINSNTLAILIEKINFTKYL